MKNICNNWLTELIGDLNFTCEDRRLPTRWAILTQPYKLKNNAVEENSGVHGISKLTVKAMYPKPVERQNVALCFRVFCDEIVLAYYLLRVVLRSR